MRFSSHLEDPNTQAQLRATLGSNGFVHIPNALEEADAKALLASFASLPWLTTFCLGDTQKQGLAAEFAAWDSNRRAAMLAEVHNQASNSFQYLYDTYRVSYECEKGQCRSPALSDYYETANGGALDLFRGITGDQGINYVDAQATRYLPGQFLTEHDDQTTDGARLFAYVLNLTPSWRTDWGGLLMLLDDEGHVRRAFAPRWNALNIFRVPQRHAVSFVVPFAKGVRYSITGWMRAAP